MPHRPPGDRAVILACSVRGLCRWWLDTERPCGRSVAMPLSLTVASGLGGLTIADLVVQLRCKQCGKRPVRVALLEHSAAGVPGRMGDRSRGGATGWVVTLVGEA